MSGWKKLWSSVTGKTRRGDDTDEESQNVGLKIEGIEKEEDDIVSGVSKMASILMQAADDHTLIEIAFGSKILIYKTRFALDVDTSSEGSSSELSSEYMRKAEYLLISEIDPPEGNDKLRSFKSGTLQFLQANRFNEFQVRLIETKMSEDGTKPAYKMSFPQAIFRRMQRRTSARFKVPEKAALILTVERPALLTFRAMIVDIGTGGLSYLHPGDVPMLTENCQLRLHFSWPPEKALSVPGILIKNKLALGKTRVNVRFTIESYEMSRELGELVSYIERLELQDRSDNRTDLESAGVLGDYHAAAAELRRKKS